MNGHRNMLQTMTGAMSTLSCFAAVALLVVLVLIGVVLVLIGGLGP